MKRKMYLMVLLLAVAITGCGGKENADSVTKAAEEEQSTETGTKEEVGEETPVAEDNEATADDTEAEARYHELLAEYMEEYGHLCVPRVREDFTFHIYDEVKSTEDVLTCSQGTYVLIHFENSAKDVMIIDSSRVDDSINDYENSEVVEAVLSEIHQKNLCTEFQSVPEVGEKISIMKNGKLSEVVDTGVIYENHRHYIVDNGYGLKNLVQVDIEDIPDDTFELYQWGYVEDGIYMNSTLGLKISTGDTKGVGLEDIAHPLPEEFETINKRATRFYEIIYGIFGFGTINIETYEFAESITEDDCEKMIQELYPGLVANEEQEIAGKIYKSANWIDESEKELIREDTMTYYRMEDNKVYIIRFVPYTMDSISVESALEAITAF